MRSLCSRPREITASYDIKIALLRTNQAITSAHLQRTIYFLQTDNFFLRNHSDSCRSTRTVVDAFLDRLPGWCTAIVPLLRRTSCTAQRRSAQ